jgi:hypothetical protein
MEENRAIKCGICQDSLVESVTHDHKPFTAICFKCIEQKNGASFILVPDKGIYSYIFK